MNRYESTSNDVNCIRWLWYDLFTITTWLASSYTRMLLQNNLAICLTCWLLLLMREASIFYCQELPLTVSCYHFSSVDFRHRHHWFLRANIELIAFIISNYNDAGLVFLWFLTYTLHQVFATNCFERIYSTSKVLFCPSSGLPMYFGWFRHEWGSFRKSSVGFNVFYFSKFIFVQIVQIIHRWIEWFRWLLSWIHLT